MQSIHGSSLIESLVAVGVFAIGSASTATWMMQSMAMDAKASRLMAATTIALSLEARMRANREGILAGAYTLRTLPTIARFRPYCDNHCDGLDRAADDLHRFERDLLQRVGPATSGTVACDTSTACEIRIWWSGQPLLLWPFHP